MQTMQFIVTYVADANHRRDSFFGHDTSANVSLDNLYCLSYTSYSKLADCPHGSITCDPAAANIAGVTCSGKLPYWQ